MMKAAFVWISLGLSFAYAKALDSANVALLINQCDTRLYLYTTNMRSREVAESIHSAIVDRGVPVVIVAPKQGLFYGAGIGVQGLVFAGATLFVDRQTPVIARILCDKEFSIVGEAVDSVRFGARAKQHLGNEVKKTAIFFQNRIANGFQITPLQLMALVE